MATDTKTRLLDHAERLFAERGIENTSIRDIVASAGENLGAITYHFGSKRSLIRAVIDRRLQPLNEERLNLLEAAERARRPGPPRLEEVLQAAIGPTIRLMRENPRFMRIVGRMFCDPSAALKRHAEAKPLYRRFLSALSRALPHLGAGELAYRVHFLRGALIHTWTGIDHLASRVGGTLGREDDTSIARRLVEFGAAGLRAPLGARPGTGAPDRRMRRTPR